MITAIVLIHADVHRIPETAQAVADISGVAEVYSCAGDVDLIAKIKVRDHAEIADVVTGKLDVRAAAALLPFGPDDSEAIEATEPESTEEIEDEENSVN